MIGNTKPKPRRLKGFAPSLIVLFMVGAGLLGFLYTYQINDFPKGNRSEGSTYIIQTTVDDGFPQSIPMKEYREIKGTRNHTILYPTSYYNESLDITYLPVIHGKSDCMSSYYFVKGNLTGSLKAYDKILLKTTWKDGLEEDDQIWEAKRYETPQVPYMITLQLIFQGIFSLPLVALSKGKVAFKRGTYIAYEASILVFLLGYFLGSWYTDFGLAALFGCVILMLIGMLLAIWYEVIYAKDPGKKKSWFYIVFIETPGIGTSPNSDIKRKKGWFHIAGYFTCLFCFLLGFPFGVFLTLKFSCWLV
jgi:hypothetical protein